MIYEKIAILENKISFATNTSKFYHMPAFILFCTILTVICVLVAVAFFTLLERKILGVVQNRKGPSRVGFLGILQPIADGLKLFMKETIIPRSSIQLIFILAPVIAFILGFLGWCFLPLAGSLHSIFSSSYSILLIFIVSILHVYSIILAGWASNSKYSFLGALRSSAQLIAYDIAMGFVILNLVLTVKSLNVVDILNFQSESGYFFFYYPLLFVIFFICALAETNRHPFDLPEAEAELVSGYNVEYSSIGFACFFLAEYSSILFMIYLMITLFFGGFNWAGQACILPPTWYEWIFESEVWNNNSSEVIRIIKRTLYRFGDYARYEFDKHIIIMVGESIPITPVKNFILTDLRLFHLTHSWKKVLLDSIIKPALFIYAFILIRGAIPRYRYDQLMSIGWKILLPLSFTLFLYSVICIFLSAP